MDLFLSRDSQQFGQTPSESGGRCLKQLLQIPLQLQYSEFPHSGHSHESVVESIYSLCIKQLFCQRLFHRIQKLSQITFENCYK